MTSTGSMAHVTTNIQDHDDGFSQGSGSQHLSVLSNRNSMSALYTIAADSEPPVEDEISRVKAELRTLKKNISVQSKRNFVLEKDVRFLDSRIALLIQNRMAEEEQNEVAKRLSDVFVEVQGSLPDERKLELYGVLFYVLQTEPVYTARLVQRVKMAEIDMLLQIVMFNLYGNQYESREEHLLLSLFQSVLSAQFASVSEFSSLLRANTPVSRMMTTYTRRGPGQSYLRSVLLDSVQLVANNYNRSLEINPLRVYMELAHAGEFEHTYAPDVSPEEILKIPAVRAEVESRSLILRDITSRFLDSILDHVDTVPYGIRWICKLIRNLTFRKFTNVPEESICSLIGGFFFLRFINPAIVSPQAYMLLDTLPSENVRKNLNAVAKIVQSLANRSAKAKDIPNAPLDSLIEENGARILTYLRKLCEVPDFFETLELDQYLALSKKDLVLNVSLNEIYSTHRIYYEHCDQIAEESSHLRSILSELGPPKELVPAGDNVLIALPLTNRWDSSIPDLTKTFSVTNADVLFVKAKSLFIQLLRVLPAGHEMTKLPFDLVKIADSAANLQNMHFMHKGLRALQYLEELSKLSVVDPLNRYAPLVSEVEHEFQNLDAVYQRLKTERDALFMVHKTISEHNEYLRSQLDIYRNYLQNARVQSSITKHSDLKNVSRGVGVVGFKGKQQKQTNASKFSHAHLVKEQVIAECLFPAHTLIDTYYVLSSPLPGSFVVTIFRRGQDQGLVKIDVKIDDLLEMQHNKKEFLDCEFVKFNVNKFLLLLRRQFNRK
ncbi:GTPase activating protein Gap1 [Schizosaccharomyces japonicus yFS275]|uniref:GTPase activating protein Gap1 n=1 Tax=Schizosaccharomyces japonicus (strain yFS275 / FY16936) TaxID=402676 RepID=B6K2B1_SCHJY|nr:GTPase activating protein Gap1 [Schizosaccharomyces japonicus yFS275]EEB07292.2 GTPase activating protein Gap1 [Schizosaccharomyces japonicus yFS275]